MLFTNKWKCIVVSIYVKKKQLVDLKSVFLINLSICIFHNCILS